MTTPQSKNKRHKLLIIDDEELVRRMIALWFEKEGFSVISAENGEKGLELAQQEVPDVTLLDVNMPGLHGFEVCKRMRAIPSLSQKVIIMTSARSYKPDIDKAKELGADDYLVKPTDFAELLGVVNRLLTTKSGAA